MGTRIVLILLITGLISCGRNEKKEEESGIFEAIEGFSSLKKIAKEAEKINQEKLKLLGTTPLSNHELKELLPETLLNLPRKKFSVNIQATIGIYVATASYGNENSNPISLTIMDGAGEGGNGAINLIRLRLTADSQEESDKGYTKTTTIAGYKGLEEYEKYNDRTKSIISFLVSDRFLVRLEGKNSTINQLKNAIQELDLNSLEEK